MNWSDLFAALALYLVLEGIMPFLNPQGLKHLLVAMAGMQDRSLRLCGLASMSVGLALLYLVRS